MRDPDAPLFAKWQELMATGQMFGRNRPIGRITVGKNNLKGHTSSRPGIWRNLLFEQTQQIELGYVRSINIDRSTTQDTATCTIVVYNDSMLSNAYSPQGLDTGIGRPGYRSLDRGSRSPIDTLSVYGQYASSERTFPTEWGYPEPEAEAEFGPVEWTHPDTGFTYNGYRVYDGGSGRYRAGADAEHNRQLLLPNRVIRTFQGYGSDNLDASGEQIPPGEPGHVDPFSDSQLVQTGIWMIDRVVFSVDGTISIECRDIGKILLEQVVYPDMIPLERFPLQYCPPETWTEEVVVREQGEPGANVVASPGAPSGYYVTSNDVHVGRNGSIYGHVTEDAFDGSTSTYWLSVGQVDRDATWAYEYITGNTRGDKVNQVVVNTVNKGYDCYVGIYEGGEWLGTDTVPYSGYPDYQNGAAEKYVRKFTISRDGDNVLNLPGTYDAEFVRITFGNLTSFSLDQFEWRAGVRTWSARYRPPEVREEREFDDLGEPGVITDWNEPIRELCGWAGFTWLADPEIFPGVRSDPLIGDSNPDTTGGGVYSLRVWGDFERLGAGPIECTPPEYFLNKSFMECINLVSNFIGALFFIDESGGAVFRMPNIFSGGNFISGTLGGGIYDEMKLTEEPFRLYRENDWPIEFHENANLIDYQVTVDDSAVRSEVLVVGEPATNDADAVVAGGYVLGLNPITGERSAIDFDAVLAGQTRLMMVPGDDTKNFRTPEECQRMAEMTALKILFTYRRGQLTSPAHPGLQIDDQVRIFERLTHEYNVHYVSGINSRMDLESGEWLMDVTTHWLGTDPRGGRGGDDFFDSWFINTINLTPAVTNLSAVEQRLGEAT